MASMMAKGSEVIGECVEAIRIEVGRKMLRIVLVCPEFWFDCDGALTGLSPDCVDGNDARYWRLICGLIGVTQEIESPCSCRAFG